MHREHRERRHAPRTYQSAWAWDDSVDSDSPPPMMRTAEEWLREEAYVQRQMADGDDETPDDDDLPDRAGIMEAIAKEIDTIRRERTQWAEAFTKLRAEHDALRSALLARHRDGERHLDHCPAHPLNGTCICPAPPSPGRASK